MEKRGQVDAVPILRKYRLPYVPQMFASTPEEAVKAARTLCYPVAIKAVAEGVLHKTDVGGVELGIDNDAMLCLAFARMRKAVEQKSGAKLTGVNVQPMVKGLEMIIGMNRDPVFGPVVVVGLGGIFVEVLKDVAMRIAPLSEADAWQMLKELKAYPLLSNYRGQSYNTQALVDIILSVSRMAVKEEGIASMDLNPVILREKDAVIVDARIL